MTNCFNQMMLSVKMYHPDSKSVYDKKLAYGWKQWLWIVLTNNFKISKMKEIEQKQNFVNFCSTSFIF